MKLLSAVKFACKGKPLFIVGILIVAGFIGFGFYAAPNDTRNNPDNRYEVYIPGGLSWQNNYWAAILGNTDLFPLLKVAVPPKARMASLLSPFGDGFDRDLLERFARDYGFSLQYTEVMSFDEAGKLLAEGQVDLAAGFTAPPNLNSRNAPDIASGSIAMGPAYQKVSPMLLTVGKTGANKKNEVMVVDPGLTEAVTQSTSTLNKEPLSDDVSELVGYLEQGHAGYALVDNAYLSMLRPLFSNINTSARTLDGSAYHHWIWRDDDSLPALSLAAFWKEKSTLRYLDDLHEKYRAFLPVKQNREQTVALMKSLEHELVQYHDAINAAAREFNIDPLLLTAIMYQESHFKNTAGKNGQGLMQLTRETAASLGVNPSDPASNIRGGAKYLRSIYDSLPAELAYWDRWFLTLAAYNQGPGILSSAMRVAEKNSGKLCWRSVKNAYLYMENHPGLENRGKVRGTHVVNYVQNIRYYYYVLNGIVILDRPEAQHLTPLLAGADSPVTPRM